MSVFIAQLLEESLESPSDVSGIHERVLEIVTQMETGEVAELVSVLKKGQEDLNEQMDTSYFITLQFLEMPISPSDVWGIHERVLDVVRQMESGEVGELVTVLKKAQEDLNEQMDFTYFKRVNELKKENKKLKEQLEEALKKKK